MLGLRAAHSILLGFVVAVCFGEDSQGLERETSLSRGEKKGAPLIQRLHDDRH